MLRRALPSGPVHISIDMLADFRNKQRELDDNVSSNDFDVI